MLVFAGRGPWDYTCLGLLCPMDLGVVLQKVPWPTHLLLRDQHLLLGVPSPEHARSQTGGAVGTDSSFREGDRHLISVAPTPRSWRGHILAPHFAEAQRQGVTSSRPPGGEGHSRERREHWPVSHVCAAHPTSLLFMKSTQCCASVCPCVNWEQ